MYILISDDSIDVTNDVSTETDVSKPDSQTFSLLNPTAYNYTQVVKFSIFIKFF